MYDTTLDRSYDYDHAGQMSGVTGTGFGQTTTTFASGMQYRAWGALKSLSYGNSTTLGLGYDLRGLPTSYAVGGVKETAGGAAHTEGSSFLYHADGRVRFAGTV